MAKKKKKQKKRSVQAKGSVPKIKGEGGVSVDPSTLSLDEAGTVVKDLISGGRQKVAVDVAKAIHAREKSSESEALLAECYIARIEGFIGKDMAGEAMGLIELVEERFPKWRDKLKPLRLSARAHQGDLDSLVAPLLNPDLPKAERSAIEEVIRCEMTDLTPLAQCGTLPSDHPLRKGAGHIIQAFESVCTGPVEDDDIALPDISRRSPLSDWKMLVRAIAFFYRHDDPACRKCLEVVSSNSAPAGLIPVIQGLIDAKPDKNVQGGARNLAEKIGGYSKALVRVLKEVDLALSDYFDDSPFKTIKRAVSECKRSNPDLLQKLKQYIFVRAYVNEEWERDIIKALGGPPLKNADYWRIMATWLTYAGRPLSACAAWEEFRLHACHEGLFASGGVEESVLYVLMANLIAQIKEDKREYNDDLWLLKDEFNTLARSYKDQPPHIREAVTKEKRDPDRFYFLNTDELFNRACAAGRAEEMFPIWMGHAKKNREKKSLDKIAEKWHQADPQNVKPLLFLAETAESRKAYKKALNYVEEAERLDELNPAVRRARFRLLAANAKRHIAQKKPHLLDKDIVAIQAAPQLQEGDRPALIGCLNWAACLLRSDTEGEAHFFNEVAGRFDSELGAWLLLKGLAQDCNLNMARKMPPIRQVSNNGSPIEVVTRVSVLGTDANINLSLPDKIVKRLVSDLSEKGAAGTSMQFRILAETALKLNQFELAYVASGAGLELGGYSEARFLYLRARSVHTFPPFRRDKCLAAALNLAKKQGDKTVVADAMEELRAESMYSFLQAEDPAAISPENVEKVLELEKKFRDPGMRIKGNNQYLEIFAQKMHDRSRGFSLPPYPGPDEPDDDDLFDTLDRFVNEDFYDDAHDDFEDDFEDEYDDDFEDEYDSAFQEFATSPQMRLFPKNAAQALLEIMMRLTERYPNAYELPAPEIIAEDDPELAREMEKAIDDYIREYGEPPTPIKLIDRAMGTGAGKNRGKQTAKKKKRRKKRK